MIPCTMIKEADPDKVKGIAPGAINFLVFSFIILLASVSGVDLMLVFGGKTPNLVIFHEPELIWLCAIVTSLILTMFLRDAAAGARPRPESLAIRAL
jgi:archaellum biogenesis protein FlaJ (TadC family)